MALPSGRVPPAELARLLREQDRQHLASARLLEENAEQPPPRPAGPRSAGPAGQRRRRDLAKSATCATS